MIDLQRHIRELEYQKAIIDKEIAKEKVEIEEFMKRSKELQAKIDNVDNLAIAISRLNDFMSLQEDQDNAIIDAWGDLS